MFTSVLSDNFKVRFGIFFPIIRGAISLADLAITLCAFAIEVKVTKKIKSNFFII